MNKEIRPKGLTLSPDDRAASDGELALCAGVELHDGTLRPSFVEGTKVLDLLYQGNLHDLVFVHVGDSYTNYITKRVVSNVASYYWWGLYPTEITGITGNVKDVSAIGNTLCFVTDTGVQYVLYKGGANPSYKYLGTQPPFVDLQFSLRDKSSSELTSLETKQPLSKEASEMFDLDNQVSGANAYAPIKEEYRSEVTENTYALINRVHSEVTEAGFFYAPFFVRYCYRLYDGNTFVRHSPPVLMPVCIGHEDYIHMNGLAYNGTTGKIGVNHNLDNELQMDYIAAKLQYKCIGSSGWTSLANNWGDIVASLDIYVSAPICRTKQGEQIKFVGLVPDTTYELRSGVFRGWSSSRSMSSNVYARIADLEQDPYNDKLFSPDVFFKVASFKPGDTLATSSYEDLPIEGSTLSALAAQERMTDDYRSHHILKANGTDDRHSFVYNKRLHVFAAEESLFGGFKSRTLLPYIDQTSGALTVSSVYVRLNTDDGVKVVNVTDGSGKVKDLVLARLPLFYPDSRAFEMIIVGTGFAYSLPMSKIPLLEGACTKGSYNGTGVTAPSATSTIVPTPSKIYVSEVNNPFTFPVEGRQTVGVGSILGLGVATRALSPGQFGDHDLMVFCTDGVWALAVNRETGLYLSAHNVSREVCSNSKSICQLDQSIIFVTKRGLMKIVEQDAVSLSDALTGKMETVSTIAPDLGTAVSSDTKATALIGAATHPVEMLQTATALYDYARERVVFFPSSGNVGYVLSLRDGSWSSIYLANIKAVINAYPYPYIEYSNNTCDLIRLDLPFNYQASDVYSGVIISRALTWADTMQVVQGFQQVNDCNTVPKLFLYGSNDMRTWRSIGNVQRNHAPYLPGHPFRYFRFAVYLSMKPQERYSSLILDVVEKYAKL